MIANLPVIVIGSGGHARVLISSLKALRRKIIGILSPDAAIVGQFLAGVCVIGNDDEIFKYSSDSILLVNGLGSVLSTEKHKDIYMKFKKGGYSFARVIHPAATVMDDVQLGEGIQIMAGAVVQTGCEIGDNAIINTGVIVDHDCKIGNHTHIAPGVVLSGDVQIGEMVHTGTAATVVQGIKIGDGVIVGAGAVVIKDIPANVMVAGVPARFIKKRD